MLVLTRKAGEKIVIGDNVHVTVVAINGQKVRIGITAPKEVVVDREEVHTKRERHFLDVGDSATSKADPEPVICLDPLVGNS